MNETEIVRAGAKAALDAVGDLLAEHRDCATYPDGVTIIPREEPEDLWEFELSVKMKSLVNATIEVAQSGSLALDDIFSACTKAYKVRSDANQGIGGRGLLPTGRGHLATSD